MSLGLRLLKMLSENRYPRPKGSDSLIFARDSLLGPQSEGQGPHGTVYPRDVSGGFSTQNNFFLYLLAVSVITLVVFTVQTLYENRKHVSENTAEIITRDLLKEDYEKVREEFLTITRDQSPKAALSTLRERIKIDNALLRSCHTLVHEIGRESYKKYGDFGKAVKFQDEICNSGYLHGMIETYFSESKDVFGAMKIVCNDYPLESFISWECYHGIGHGLMYFTSNNLPLSLTKCDSYAGIFARSSCVNGVFMENFNTDQKLHPSMYLKEDNPFYPCPDQKLEHKGDCYLYAPTFYLSLNRNEYVKGLQWCRGAEKDFTSSCIQGVGSQAIKENINDPKFVEAVCESGQKSEIEACISGMVGLYINHFGGLDETRLLCDTLQPENKSICKDIIKSNTGWFTN